MHEARGDTEVTSSNVQDSPSGAKNAAGAKTDERLDSLLRRISELTGESVAAAGVSPPRTESAPPPRRTEVRGADNGYTSEEVEEQHLAREVQQLRASLTQSQDGADSSPPPEPLASSEPAPAKVEASDKPLPDSLADSGFLPREPRSFRESGLTESQVEELVLKFLLSLGMASGREVSDQIKLPFNMVDDLLTQMKKDQLVFYYGTAPMNDYVYQLTDNGRDRARRLNMDSTYFGSAPVDLNDYIASVAAQSMTDQHPTEQDLNRAFSDLLINKNMLRRLGPAINSGRGLFLYGAPGNGKTSIAERVTVAFGSLVWIPRAIVVDGQILRLFDPMHHEEVPLSPHEGLLEDHQIDKRWIRITRPTIVVGGELTMDNLEVTLNTTTGVCEAPFQLKSNCGTLVIDDFGRQRMSTDELLNRWIVPLEKRYDFLNLPNGKKIQVPFDQLIIFSTNLEPKQLVDDAFLRRIPYKIEVTDPSEEEYRELFRLMAKLLKIPHEEGVVDHLITNHYRANNRPFRCCQPRDLLLQIRNYCFYTSQEPKMTKEFMDLAVENYFAVM
ncbi:MAG: AAA family ATPase [Pirellulales bacterium]|nr:AAA family ATPase [Pirellulales bacterium]